MASNEQSPTQQQAGTTPAAANDNDAPPTIVIEHHPLVIVGGGIGGLVLALCLDQVYNHPNDNDDSNDDDDESPSSSPAKSSASASSSASNPPTRPLPIRVYESAAAYTANAGGAIGLYSNGLRVLRHLSGTHPDVPALLDDVRRAGCDYRYRRWMRHDGTEVAVAREDELLPDVGNDGDGGDDDEDEVEEGNSKNDNGRSGEDDDERSTGSGGTSSTAESSSSSNGKSKRRPRGDSVSSQDREGERADRRPRGGSFGSARRASSARRSSGRSSRIVETELLSLGIRRWKYQQVLYDACSKAGIEIHFGKRLVGVTSMPAEGENGEEGSKTTLLRFKDGSEVTTSLLVGADGINSKVRNYVTNPQNLPVEDYVPEYTGVTCLMGCANVPRIRGICFPSSATTKCHACYYPTRAPREGTDDDPSDYEQVFQIYFPTPVESQDTWRTLSPTEAKEECRELAGKLREDGWDEQFLKPLESETLTGVLRVGLRSREGLDSWNVGGDSNEDAGRAVLLGDAAHPPVPYIGQGAMMAMEDAGTLSMILGHYCPLIKHDNPDEETTAAATAMPDFSQFKKAMEVYEELRVPRTKIILGSSVQLGKTQQKRAESKLYNAWREMTIKAQVWAYGTLPVMRPGAAFDYRSVVEEALAADSECGEVEEG